MSQYIKIVGEVSVQNESIAVSLFNEKDSSFVKVSFCDSKGKFEFEQVKEGVYFIEVSCVGYKKFISKTITATGENNFITLSLIVLEPTAVDLANVTVNTKKPFVERRADKVVVNPDALISSAGATALEMLEKAPGVLVTVDGIISMKGKPGVMVFIDDKPSYLSAADLAAYLRSLPASSIESIELMTNPPARYDAAGNAGIINIRLKKNKTLGYSGGINIGYGQGIYFRTNNSVNFSYRINRFNFFSNISVSQNNSFQDLTIKRYYFNPDGSYSSGFIQNSYIKKENRGNSGRIGADFYISQKNTIGIVLSGFINPSFSPITNKATVLNNSNTIISNIQAFNPSDKKWKNGSVNLNWNLKTNKPGREISANADYIIYRGTHTQNLVNSIFDAGSVLQEKTTLRSSLPSSIDIKTVKVDFTTPLTDGGKIDAGAKTSFINTDNTADFFDVVNAVPIPNYQFSNRFVYKENINAAYINFAKDWKQLSVQAGLRMENTNISGRQFGNPQVRDSAFTRDYTSLFPTLYVAWRLDTTNTHQLGFSLGRRIERPNYQDMNPFTYPIDRYTFYGGNPFLQPTFSYNFELSHTYKNFITTTLEYSIANNLIQESNEQRNTIFYSRPGNFGRQVAYGISVNGEFQLAKWWKLQLYTECKSLGYQSIIYGQVLDASRFYFYVGPTNQFVITKTVSAELAGSYQSRILVAQFLTIPVWQMSAGMSKKILKGKGTIKINLSDMFYTNQPGGDIRNIENAKANWLSYLDSRVLTVGFSYRFNKGKALSARQSGGSDAEKGRVKTQ